MAALQTPPPLGTFRFVLRRKRYTHFDPKLRNTITCYVGTVETRDITHSDGRRAQTVFVQDERFRNRLWKMGWEDVTSMFFEAQLPNGTAGQTDSHTLARMAREAAERDGGVEVVNG